jgi:hypothetical protein
MPIPTPNAAPKTRFMEVESNVSKHRDMLALREFERGTDFAMLQYQARLTSQASTADAGMINGLKLQGAAEYLLELKMLAEAPKPAAPRIVEGLDLKA